VERIFEDVERAVRLARQVAASREGALRVATNYPASRLLVLSLLEQLRHAEPQLGLLLREMSTPDQLPGIARGDLDLGLVYGPVDHPELAARYLLDVPVVATIRAGHPLAAQSTLSYQEIRRHRYLTPILGRQLAAVRAKSVRSRPSTHVISVVSWWCSQVHQTASKIVAQTASWMASVPRRCGVSRWISTPWVAPYGRRATAAAGV
jgi:DNA-binding transcriptional LysR family regulator